MARGLLNDPWILFLDEPTLGPRRRRGPRPSASSCSTGRARSPGRTVLLTTHYMAEADELCERIAIVDHGRILAIGTPDELKKRVQRESIFRLELDQPRRAASRRWPGCPGVVSAAPAADIDPELQRVAVNLVLEEDARAGRRGHARWPASGSHILALRKSEPTLEDVFVELVGRGFGDDGAGGGDAGSDGSDGQGPDGRGRAVAAPRRRGRRRRGPAALAQRRRGRRGLPGGGAPMTAGTAPAAAPAGEPARRSSPRRGTAPTRGSASMWTRRQVAENNARALVGRAFPRVRGMVREPSWVFFEILLPFLTTSAFVLVYRTLQAPEAYVGFVVLGGAMAAFWLNVVWMMAAQLYWEKDQGNLELYFAAPDEPDVGAAGDGRRRADHELDAGARDPRGLDDRCSASRSTSSSGACCIAVFFLTLSALYGLGMAMASLYPAVGPRGVPHDQRDDRARVLRVRAQLPGRAAGRARRARDRHDPVRRRPRRDAPARVRRRSRTSPARRRPRWRR